MKGIDAQVAQTEKPPTEDQKRIVRKEVDLNGINPLDCLIGAVPVAALSYGSWQLTNGVAAWFNEHPVMLDFYPAQRLAIAIELLLVALSSLGAGIFGFTALGLFALGLRVAYGVATGELDPDQAPTGPVEQSTIDKVSDLLSGKTEDRLKAEVERKKEAEKRRE